MKVHLRKNESSGKLIVFEGIDGAGKTTMIEMTKAWLASKYGSEKVVCLKQPTDLSRKTKLKYSFGLLCWLLSWGERLISSSA